MNKAKHGQKLNKGWNILRLGLCFPKRLKSIMETTYPSILERTTTSSHCVEVNLLKGSCDINMKCLEKSISGLKLFTTKCRCGLSCTWLYWDIHNISFHHFLAQLVLGTWLSVTTLSCKLHESLLSFCLVSNTQCTTVLLSLWDNDHSILLCLKLAYYSITKRIQV